MNGSTPRRVLSLIAVGATGGLLSGAFGVGGGIIMVPLLLWLARMDQRRAAATSLVAIVPSAISGTIQYAVQGQVDVTAGLILAAGGVAGSLIGTKLLRALPLGWLRWLFIALLVLVAIRLFFEVPSREAQLSYSPGVVLALAALGLVVGVASGLFGIGGGVILVPVLIAFFGLGDLLAKGTSLLAMIPTSITGSVANLRAGLVVLGDGLIVGLAAVVASFGGVALAFLLPPRLAAVLFAGFLVLVVAQLVFRALRSPKR
ncbi:MAG: uncharacterized protein JWP32_430 [Schumannella sp.]|jgi:uncharacterized membrane protein YfcA|nr:uncharacterized protein [Schumannella sp.]